MAQGYKDLQVWQKAMRLVADVYRLTASFPDREKFGLISQLRRAAVSVPSNIAEGQGRLTVGEFKQFLGHARGPLFRAGNSAADRPRSGICERSRYSSTFRASGGSRPLVERTSPIAETELIGSRKIAQQDAKSIKV